MSRFGGGRVGATSPITPGTYVPIPAGSGEVGQVPTVTDDSPLTWGWGDGGAGLPSDFITVTANHTAVVGQWVKVNAASGPITVALPPNPAIGALVAVQKDDASGNTVTIDPSGAGTIQGDSTATTTTRYAGGVFTHEGEDSWNFVPLFVSGADGTDGIDGIDGDDGVDGETVRSGSGVPSGGLGADGDFYINTAAWTIYGPKIAGAWGSPTTIIGTNGTNGSTILSGSGAPGGGTGANGDFYINTAANNIYGPKTAGAWGSATTLVGPAGASGAGGTAFAFGDGSDGDVIISVDTVLSRTMYYSSLTVNAGVTLDTKGVLVLVKNTLTLEGTIAQEDGGGLNGTTASRGGGFSPALWFQAAIGGGDNTTGAGGAGTAVTSAVGSAGAVGGLGSSGAGGAAGAVTAPAAAAGGVHALRTLPNILTGRVFPISAVPLSIGGGSGGGAGGGDGTNKGGGGGGGGGICAVVARLLAGTGTLKARGGNGGNGAGGNAGGGGGGGGGAVVLVSTATTNPYTISVPGGTGGTKVGTGVNGSNGSTGTSFLLLGV